MDRTKRAFCKHVTTSSGSVSETVGFCDSAECCQLSGGCASAIVVDDCWSRDLDRGGLTRILCWCSFRWERP